jgi:hypothetical protein
MLKRYTLSSIDQIPAELIQAGGEALRSEIDKLINSTWNKEKLLQHWKESIIVPIYKGDKTELCNFRGISQFSQFACVIWAAKSTHKKKKNIKHRCAKRESS